MRYLTEAEIQYRQFNWSLSDFGGSRHSPVPKLSSQYTFRVCLPQFSAETQEYVSEEDSCNKESWFNGRSLGV